MPEVSPILPEDTEEMPDVSQATPQTKTDIMTMLRAEGFRPNRRRGQNFLVDGNLMRLVVESAELTPRDLAFEVGTGTASLTRMLSAAAGEVVTVEVDPMLQSVGERVLADCANVTRIEGDALEGKHHVSAAAMDALRSGAARGLRLKLVANLPYSIATPLLMNLLWSDVEFERMVFTVQREMAERIAAVPGDDAYGWVSVIVALAGSARIVRRFPPTVFWPKPTIDSSLVVLSPAAGWRRGIDVERLQRFGTFVFQQQRKTSQRILRDYLKRRGVAQLPEAVLGAVGIDPQTRGNRLRPADILKLSQAIP